MNEVWAFLERHLADGKAATLMTVAQRQGSAPGRPGFKMAVTGDGRWRGTIGGGIMEINLSAKARVMAERNDPPELVDQIHREQAPPAQRSGMICAGSQKIALIPLRPDRLPLVRRIHEAVSRRLPGVITLDREGLSFDSGEGRAEFRDGDDWRYREPVGRPDTVYVIGSGHVGLAICRVLATLDLHVSAFDHRPQADTFVNNLYAHEKRATPYEALGEIVPEGDASYVVVATTAFSTDLAAMRQVVGKRLRYLGLMGSAAKIKRIFKELERSGVDPGLLKKVRAPIGVPIGNRTPAEIAVSVAAEIIKVRNAAHTDE